VNPTRWSRWRGRARGGPVGRGQGPPVLDVNAPALGVETQGGVMTTLIERNTLSHPQERDLSTGRMGRPRSIHRAAGRAPPWARHRTLALPPRVHHPGTARVPKIDHLRHRRERISTCRPRTRRESRSEDHDHRVVRPVGGDIQAWSAGPGARGDDKSGGAGECATRPTRCHQMRRCSPRARKAAGGRRDDLEAPHQGRQDALAKRTTTP